MLIIEAIFIDTIKDFVNVQLQFGPWISSFHPSIPLWPDYMAN